MAEKKLYQVDVEVSFDMVVAAESPEEARRYAEEHYEEELRNQTYPGVYGSVHREPLTKCPQDWVGCSPYNTDDGRTVDQYFEKKDEPAGE